MVLATILIGTRQPLPILRQEIELEFVNNGPEGTALVFEELQTGRHSFLDLTVLPATGDRGESDQIKRYFSKLIGHLLTGLISQDIMERLARTEYPFASRDDLLSVVSSSRRILAENDGEEQIQKIVCNVEEFLKNHESINLEGFLRFRLKGYIDRLREVVEQALENFLAEKEYKEFIRLLRYFVENQEPRVNEVHVVIYTAELFRLLDEEQKPLEPEYLQGILGEFSDNELNYEDLLLSALITLAPRRIYLHHPKDIEITTTIQQVFNERVQLCSHCDLCDQSFPGSLSMNAQTIKTSH